MSKSLSKFGEAFVSYGSYHNDPVNQWIHIICVPLIAATLICALSYVPFSFQLMGYTLGADVILVASILLYYFSINPLFGSGMFILMLGMAYGWRLAFAGMEEDKFFKWVIGIHIVSWILQFIGHGVFQKRKPALLDNLTQIFNAPLFVVVEIIGKLGYKSEEMKEWQEIINKRVAQFRAGQQNAKQN